jgi:hypothetical protein
MAGKNKKQSSIFGTVISIYLLFMLLTRVLRTNMNIKSGNVIIVIVIGIIVATRILSIASKASKSGEADFRTERMSRKHDIAEKLKDNLDKRKSNVKSQNKLNDSEEFIKIDETNHYANQYKNLYESGIMTKEELNDRINKLNK